MTATPIAIRSTFRPVSIEPSFSRRRRGGTTCRVWRDEQCQCESEDSVAEEEAAEAQGEDQAEHGDDAGEDFEAEEPQEPEQSEHERNEDRDEWDHDEQHEEPEEPAHPPACRRQRTSPDRTFGHGHEARSQPQGEDADEQDGQEVANRVADEVRRPVERRLRLPDLNVVAPADLPRS